MNPNLIDKFWMMIAWLLPRKLVEWCFVRVTAHATTGKYSGESVPGLLAVDALNRWHYKDSEKEKIECIKVKSDSKTQKIEIHRRNEYPP